MKTSEITNSEDIIDSRDIIERIEELEEERGNLEQNITDLEMDYNECQTAEEVQEIEEAKQALIDFDESEEGQELETLKKLAEEGEGCSDWQYGEALIRESYFEQYCEELCQDIGDIPKDLPWYIADHIDWEGVSREIRMDYTEVDFDGITYLIRS